MSFDGNPFQNNGNSNQPRWFSTSSNAGTSFSFAINPPQTGRYDVNVNWNQNYFPGQGQGGVKASNPYMPVLAPATEEMFKTTGKDHAYNRPPTPYHSPPPPYSFQASPNVSGFPASTENQEVSSGLVGMSVVGQAEALKNKKPKKTTKLS